jgi:hypothetical protein
MNVPKLSREKSGLRMLLMCLRCPKERLQRQNKLRDLLGSHGFGSFNFSLSVNG